MDSGSGIDIGFKEHQPDEKSLVCADTLKITYDLGIRIFGECLRAASPDGEDEKLLPALLLRDICRHVMATAILAKNGFAEPCDLTVRALYESCASVMYMLDGDTAKKAASYRVMNAIGWIKLAKKLSPFTGEGKELKSRLQDDRLGKLDSPIYKDVPDATKELEELLKELRSDPVCEEAFQEYRRIMERQKGKGGRLPAWFQLFGGPTSIKGLAGKTRTLYAYEIFYSLASKTAHGVNALRLAGIRRSDGTLDIPIMSSRNIEVVAATAVSFVLITYREMIERFCPEMRPAYNGWLLEVRRLMTKAGIPSSATDHKE
jgi:hypothetical protein